MVRSESCDGDSQTVIGFVGDMMLGRRVSAFLERSPPDGLLGDVPSILAGCDGVVANLESPITRHAKKWSQCWKSFHYRSVPTAIDCLHAARVCAVSLANNHILDFEAQGMLDTCRTLAGAGIAYAGAGTTIERARAGALTRIGNVMLGLIGITDNMPEWQHPDPGGCTFYARIDDDAATFATIGRQAEQLRHSGADIVVLSVHWGWMPVPIVGPPRRHRRFAHRAIDCGVDVVHGHSSHLLQGVEIYGGGLILYDTGNFIDDYWIFPGFPMTRSAMFMLEFRAREPIGLRVVPLVRRRCHVETARGRMRRLILADLEARCRRFGTRTDLTDASLNIDLCPSFTAAATARRNASPEWARATAGT